jgi:hypothetical protein
MPLVASCPHCQRSTLVSFESVGKLVECCECGDNFASTEVRVERSLLKNITILSFLVALLGVFAVLCWLTPFRMAWVMRGSRKEQEQEAQEQAEAAKILKSAGWTANYEAIYRSDGLRFLVTATNGERRFQVRGSTKTEAWWAAVEQIAISA